MSTTSGCKDIWITKLEFVAKTHFHLVLKYKIPAVVSINTFLRESVSYKRQLVVSPHSCINI